MQYDENAEKYGYEGEMTPLKCDELKIYVAPTPDGTGLADYCLKSDVDAALTELKDVIHELQVDLEGAKATAYADSVDAGMRERRLRRALYKACANWASSESCFWDGYAADLAEHKPAKSDILTAKSRRFEMMEIKCLKKADKYKCTPDCNYYHEIWDEKELKEELAKDEDKLLFDKEADDG